MISYDISEINTKRKHQWKFEILKIIQKIEINKFKRLRDFNLKNS